MPSGPRKQEPDIPMREPETQPEPGPQEIPQDKDIPEKESPPMQGSHLFTGGCLPTFVVVYQRVVGFDLGKYRVPQP